MKRQLQKFRVAENPTDRKTLRCYTTGTRKISLGLTPQKNKYKDGYMSKIIHQRNKLILGEMADYFEPDWRNHKCAPFISVSNLLSNIL